MFWNTANTFHVPWGEMIITPHDFSVLSGLPFLSRSVETEDLHLESAGVEVLLGPIVPIALDEMRRARKSTNHLSASHVTRGLRMHGATDE